MSDDASPISARHAKTLFAGFRSAPALVLAVSGGPDSLALMWLAARWRKALRRGPQLVVVTIDHGLRAESAGEARAVGRLAAGLDLPHRTLRWTGAKPTTGVPAAAREARYRLLAKAARASGASHILTAHTQDDQAETFLMRMARGSGLAGLAAMAPLTERDGVLLARPLLEVSKAELVATLTKAKLPFATDPGNTDSRFTRARWRKLLPQLAAEGCDSRNLARLAGRLARANAALDLLTDAAERYLVLQDRGTVLPGFHAAAFVGLPAEIKVRLLLRWLTAIGHEGPPELGKAETLLAALEQAGTLRKTSGNRFRQSLAGAIVTLSGGRLRIDPAPPRRRPSR
jgi:tRNA(Ile)-lysidine synthase